MIITIYKDEVMFLIMQVNGRTIAMMMVLFITGGTGYSRI